MAFNPPDVQISHSVNLSNYLSHLSIYLSFYFGSECRVPLLYETICHQRVGFTEELEHRNSSLSCPSEIVFFLVLNREKVPLDDHDLRFCIEFFLRLMENVVVS